jgi:hypothetical protein
MEFIELSFSERIPLKRKCVRLQLVSIFYTLNRFLISVLISKSIHLQFDLHVSPADTVNEKAMQIFVNILELGCTPVQV